MTVYIVQAGGADGPVKIGYSDGARLKTRLRGIQTASASSLVLLREIPGGATVGRWLHKTEALKRLDQLNAIGDARAIEVAQRQLESIRDIAMHWDEEIRDLDMAQPTPPSLEGRKR